MPTLAAGDIKTRARARETLVAIGEPAAKPLATAVFDDDDTLAEQSASVLGQLGGDEAMAALAEVVESEDGAVTDKVRLAAFTALVDAGYGIGDGNIIDLADKLLDYPYGPIRNLAASVLMQGGTGGFERLAAALEGDSPVARAQALYAIEHLGPIAVEQLMALAQEDDLEVSQVATERIFAAKGTDAVAAQRALFLGLDEELQIDELAAAKSLPDDEHEALLVTGLQSAYASVRDLAVNKLMQADSTALCDLNEDEVSAFDTRRQGQLARFLHDTCKSGVGETVAMALAAANEYSPGLLYVLVDAPSPEEAMARLVPALGSEDDAVRRTAYTLLGQVSATKAKDSLLAGLDDKNDDVSRACREGLKKLGRSIVPEAIEAAEGFGADGVAAVVWLVADLGGEQALAFARAQLGHAHADVRRAALVSLVEARVDDEIELLTDALNDPSRTQRLYAARELIDRDPPGMEDTMRQALSSHNKATVQRYYLVYVLDAWDEAVPDLVRILDAEEDKPIALDYLNSGEPTLEQAARDWAKRYGYTVMSMPGGAGGVRWGGH